MASLLPLEIARLWHTAHREHQALVDQSVKLSHQIDRFAKERTDHDKTLRSLLDNATPQRLFQVEPGVVVMVSATRGVEVVLLEAQPPAGGSVVQDHTKVQGNG